MWTPPLPWAAVPGLDNHFSEEIFSNIETKRLQAELEAIFSCPITFYLGEEETPTSLLSPSANLASPIAHRNTDNIILKKHITLLTC